MIPLLKLCEPIFVQVCEVNRCGRVNKKLSYERIKESILNLLKDIDSQLKYGSEAFRQYKRIELAFLFFIDSMICESDSNINKKWDKNRLAYVQGELTGDEKFYKIMDELFNDFSSDSEACLNFFFACLCLGFTGVHRNNPVTVKYYFERILVRLPYLAKEEVDLKIGVNATDNVDSRNLSQRTWFSGPKLAIISLILCIVFIIFNTVLYLIAATPVLKIFNEVITRILN
ncbi:MAG: DotU family type IV/VI secretion system protein [bacterium]|nr:DotU family type IV/VI secretion system protein [bacterium]